jgi:hypothetical protein
MDEKTSKIVITNKLDDDQDKNQVIRKLAVLFKIDEQKAAQLLAKPRTTVKDNLDAATAKKYFAAIRQTGAHCEIINKKIETELPQIVEPPKVKPDIIVKTNAQHPAMQSVRDTELALVEREQKIEKETREKLDTLKNASEETLCPQCGTIRGSVDAACLHCGYDPNALPAEASQPKSRKVKYALIASLLALVIGAVIAWPFYQKHLFYQHIQQGLQLAFDTRNQITDFIKRTSFWPNQNIDAGLPDNISNNIVESIIVNEGGVMTVTLRADAIRENSPQTIIFAPRLVNGVIAWNCHGGNLREELRPEACQQAQ